jgi:hypothetical protein
MVRPVLNLLTNQTPIRYLQLQETCYAYTKLINQTKEKEMMSLKKLTQDKKATNNRYTYATNIDTRIGYKQLTKYQMQRVMSDLEL